MCVTEPRVDTAVVILSVFDRVVVSIDHVRVDHLVVLHLV